jgi:ketosteroid isomerase-like protein
MPTGTQQATEAGSLGERVARAFLDGIIAGDETAIRETLADNAVLVLPRPTAEGATIAGGANLAAALVGIGARYAAQKATYGTVLGDEQSAAVEWRLQATLRATGADYDQFYSWFFDLAGGKIVEVREYLDTVYGHRMNDDANAAVVARHTSP